MLCPIFPLATIPLQIYEQDSNIFRRVIDGENIRIKLLSSLKEIPFFEGLIESPPKSYNHDISDLPFDKFLPVVDWDTFYFYLYDEICEKRWQVSHIVLANIKEVVVSNPRYPVTGLLHDVVSVPTEEKMDSGGLFWGVTFGGFGFLLGACVFFGSWIYAISTYGWFLGLALGWIPAGILAIMAMIVSPLVLLLLVLVLLIVALLMVYAFNV